ncbi:hypothetical protein D3C81_1157140 [compost metagenome]
MNRHPADRCNANLPAVLGIGNHPACDIHRQREGNEFLQLPQPAELAQHQLAEDDFSDRCPHGSIQGVKQHAQRQRNEGKILDRQLNRPQLHTRDQLREHVGQSVE